MTNGNVFEVFSLETGEQSIKKQISEVLFCSIFFSIFITCHYTYAMFYSKSITDHCSGSVELIITEGVATGRFAEISKLIVVTVTTYVRTMGTRQPELIIAYVRT